MELLIGIVVALAIGFKIGQILERGKHQVDDVDGVTPGGGGSDINKK
jgi:hypothetical protein